MLRVLTQIILLLPTLAAAAVLPMLFLATPAAIVEGSWLAALFNAFALPGLLALIASVALPKREQMSVAAGRLAIIGIFMALTASVAISVLVTRGADGQFHAPAAPDQLILIGGPLIVSAWNLWRIAGATIALGSVAGALVLVIAAASVSI